jgi:hypothetical protein
VTDEKRQNRIKGLLEERAAYKVRGNDDGVEAVNAELMRLGAEGVPPVKRATRRDHSVVAPKEKETKA